jgi:hypothetical protein
MRIGTGEDAARLPIVRGNTSMPMHGNGACDGFAII